MGELRRRFGYLSLAILGAALVALPAVAGSQTDPAVEAIDKPGSGIYAEERHAWSPTQASVTTGGVVKFRNASTTVPHGVQWVGGPSTPVCSGVPVATEATTSGAGWSGACTFTQAGTYTFYCTVHGPEMTGTVVVTAAGASPAPVSTVAPPSGTAPVPAPGGEPAAPGTFDSPLAGTPSQAIKLRTGQSGRSVRGSVRVSQAGLGGRLEVELLAKGASVAKADRSARVPVGRLVRSSLYAGVAPFSVPLDTKGKRALTRHRRLALTVRIVLAPLHGSPVTVTRGVLLRP